MQASANLYALLQTCRANGVNTYDYLKTLFAALPKATTGDDYEALLPWRLGTSTWRTEHVGRHGNRPTAALLSAFDPPRKGRG